MYKKIICLDFDGVIHSYTSGWRGPSVVTDPPVPGAMQFILGAIDKGFNVAVYSARSGQRGGIEAMKAAIYTWMILELGFENRELVENIVKNIIQWPKEKPSAHITIDDRAWLFEGTWPSLEEVEEFKPWNKK